MYISLADYIRRNGEREAVILTNEDSTSPTPDYVSETIVDAITDASGFADGYIGIRYAAPLSAPVPRIVQQIVNDLAREALHKTRVPEDVRSKADLARSQLKDISAGRMKLDVAEGGTPAEETGSGAPASSLDRDCPTFSRATMSSYMYPYPSGGGNYAPCWRRGG